MDKELLKFIEKTSNIVMKFTFYTFCFMVLSILAFVLNTFTPLVIFLMIVTYSSINVLSHIKTTNLIKSYCIK